jgi:DNA (cytosine-5)-methyltransferase 1
MRAADLFAGLGGFTEGARQAGCAVVWAADHWPAAVNTHAANHPDAVHACQDLQQADFGAVPPVDVVLASPACQGHSTARGKDRPHHDNQRATAWAVVAAVEVTRPSIFVVENVLAFQRWKLYPAWCAAMAALGYALSPMVIDAADHGVPQHRPRLFFVGSRSRCPITLQLPTRPHVSAASFARFDAGRWSPVDRVGRSPSTIARVAAGRRAHGDRFVMPYYGSGSGLTGRSLARPIGTITTRDRWALVDGDRMRMLSAVECRDAMGFPPHYVLPDRHQDAVHMLGNAVCPAVPRDILIALREAA